MRDVTPLVFKTFQEKNGGLAVQLEAMQAYVVHHELVKKRSCKNLPYLTYPNQGGSIYPKQDV